MNLQHERDKAFGLLRLIQLCPDSEAQEMFKYIRNGARDLNVLARDIQRKYPRHASLQACQPQQQRPTSVSENHHKTPSRQRYGRLLPLQSVADKIVSSQYQDMDNQDNTTRSRDIVLEGK